MGGDPLGDRLSTGYPHMCISYPQVYPQVVDIFGVCNIKLSNIWQSITMSPKNHWKVINLLGMYYEGLKKSRGTFFK